MVDNKNKDGNPVDKRVSNSRIILGLLDVPAEDTKPMKILGQSLSGSFQKEPNPYQVNTKSTKG
jgi:hypothetical protein